MANAATSLADQIAAIQNKLETGHSNRMTFLGETKTRLGVIKSKVVEKLQELADCNNNVAEVKTSLEATTAQNTQLQNQIADLGAEKDNLEKSIALQTKEIAELRAGNTTAANDLERANQELQQKTAEIERNKLSQQMASAANDVKQVVLLKAQKTQLESELNNAINEKKSAEQELANNSANLSKLQGDLNDLKQQLDAVNSQLAQAQQSSKDLTSAKESLEAQLAAFTSEREALQTQLKGIADALEARALNEEAPMQNEILQLLQDIDTALTTSAAPPPEPANTSTVIGAPPGTVQTEVERINDKTGSELSSPKQGTNGSPIPGNSTMGSNQNRSSSPGRFQNALTDQQKAQQKLNAMNNLNVKYGSKTYTTLPSAVSAIEKMYPQKAFLIMPKLMSIMNSTRRDKPTLINGALQMMIEGKEEGFTVNNPAGGRRRTRKVRRHRKRRTARKQRGGFMYSKTSRRPSLSSRRSRRSASRRRSPF